MVELLEIIEITLKAKLLFIAKHFSINLFNVSPHEITSITIKNLFTFCELLL